MTYGGVADSWCSFSMMVKWANDGLLQANDGKMSVWTYTHFTIIDEHFTIINKHFTIINLKYTIIRSFDHHWEAEPTAKVFLYGAFLSMSLTKTFEQICPLCPDKQTCIRWQTHIRVCTEISDGASLYEWIKQCLLFGAHKHHLTKCPNDAK